MIEKNNESSTGAPLAIYGEGMGVRSLGERALNIKLLLTDCDGVLTDGGVYYGENGEAFKAL